MTTTSFSYFPSLVDTLACLANLVTNSAHIFNIFFLPINIVEKNKKECLIQPSHSVCFTAPTQLNMRSVNRSSTLSGAVPLAFLFFIETSSWLFKLKCVWFQLEILCPNCKGTAFPVGIVPFAGCSFSGRPKFLCVSTLNHVQQRNTYGVSHLRIMQIPIYSSYYNQWRSDTRTMVSHLICRCICFQFEVVLTDKK